MGAKVIHVGAAGVAEFVNAIQLPVRIGHRSMQKNVRLNVPKIWYLMHGDRKTPL